jgi:hypothetical protein
LPTIVPAALAQNVAAMSLYERVPQIDLSPEFSDPPYASFVVRDYARLLGDLFYFPQSVRDYMRGYARAVRSESRPPQTRAVDAWGAWLRTNPVQTDFLWMVTLLGMVLVIVIVNGAGLLAAAVAGGAVPLAAMAWAMLLAFVALLVMLAIGAVGDEAGALAPFALPMALALGLTWLACAAAPLLGLRDGFAGVALLAFAAALAYGVAAAALFATASVGVNGMWVHVAVATVISVLLAMAIGIFGWPAAQEAESAAPLLANMLWLALLAALGYLLGALRLDDYLLHARNPGAKPSSADWLGIARVTPLPLPHLHDHMTAWLDFGWQQGMDNCVSLWWYTGQQASVRRAMHEVLRGDHPAPPLPDPGIKLDANAGRTAERALSIVTRAADNPARYPWAMLSYAPANARDFLRALRPADHPDTAAGGETSPSVQRRLKRQRLRQGGAQRSFMRPLPSDKPEEALVATFWYLDKGYLGDALTSLRKAPATPQSAEMVGLVQALYELGSQENLLFNAHLTLPQPPLKPFRPAAWKALASVQEVVRFATLARQAVTPQRRALAIERTLHELHLLRTPMQPLTVETRYLCQLAELWAADFDTWLDGTPAPEPQAPVENPFLYAEPLRSGRMFVNRARELAGLAHAWQSGNLQPLLLHGGPLTGKTSLLYAAERAMPSIEIAWFHLGHADRKRMTLPQVLGAVEQAVRHTSVLEVTSFAPSRIAPVIAAPAGADIFAETERVIRRCCALLQPRNLVLVLDDFDEAEALLKSEAALPAFHSFIAHLFQTISNFTVVYVHRQLPEAASVSTEAMPALAVGPIAVKETARLLRPPGFALYFSDEAVSEVFAASEGQPYLAQLLAHAVVERFNRQAAQKQGESLICAEDVQAVSADLDFVQRANRLLGRTEKINGAQPGVSALARGEQAGHSRLQNELQEIKQTSRRIDSQA